MARNRKGNSYRKAPVNDNSQKNEQASALELIGKQTPNNIQHKQAPSANGSHSVGLEPVVAK